MHILFYEQLVTETNTRMEKVLFEQVRLNNIKIKTINFLIWNWNDDLYKTVQLIQLSYNSLI